MQLILSAIDIPLLIVGRFPPITHCLESLPSFIVFQFPSLLMYVVPLPLLTVSRFPLVLKVNRFLHHLLSGCSPIHPAYSLRFSPHLTFFHRLLHFIQLFYGVRNVLVLYSIWTVLVLYSVRTVIVLYNVRTVLVFFRDGVNTRTVY